jgi:alkylated DNA repair dioxygenase AlkB
MITLEQTRTASEQNSKLYSDMQMIKIYDKLIDSEKGTVKYFPSFFTEDESNILFEELKKLQWEQRAMKMYGKEINLPRLTNFYGEPGTQYIYSGIVNKAIDWNDNVLIQIIKKSIENVCGEIVFTNFLGNYYRNGNDSIGWHSDDEKELKYGMIASLSFGGTRRFDLKDNQTQEITKVNLKHGDLLLMIGDIQKNFKHQVAKTKNADERINLTFRVVK